MRFIISLVIGLLLFAAAGMAVTTLHRDLSLGYWPAVLLLGVSALGAGYAIGFNARDAFGGLVAGFGAAAYLWFVDRSSAWATEVLKAPLTNLNTDEVL
ncbi:MAG TPA: hypothetical protein VEI97_00685, partial [bacterium]|nr:hypothetical protein [bacterium]